MTSRPLREPRCPRRPARSLLLDAAGGPPIIPAVSHVFRRSPTSAARRRSSRGLHDLGRRRPCLSRCCGGAIVVGVGHGANPSPGSWPSRHRVAYAHGTRSRATPSNVTRGLAPHLPMDDSGDLPGVRRSEAMDRRSSSPVPTTSPAARLSAGSSSPGGGATTATRSARWTFPGASRCAGRTRPGSDASGTSPRPTRIARASRRERPGRRGGARRELERAIEAAGPGTVAAFVAEPIVGATLAAAVPPDGYWPAIAEVCRRHGVLLIADEVMTGFGRTGTWFGLDHWGPPGHPRRAKGGTSGYFPFGFVAASGDVPDAVLEGPGFVHGFTYSHHVVGAAVAGEVLRILEDERLVEASATKGAAPRPPPRAPRPTIRTSARSGAEGS